jgi:SAM-dependent methyltransferase
MCKSVWLEKKAKSTYDKDYYDRGSKSWLMKVVDIFSFWDRYYTLNLSKSDRILEIGFGEGKFLKELMSRKYNVAGVEQSEYARDKMKKILGSENVFGDIGKVLGKFEVVVMYHVLEHIQEPKEYLKKIMRILTPGGRLIVRVPNIDSLEARLAGPNWYHLDFPNHQILFGEVGLVKMFEDVGYKDIKSRNYFGEYRQVLGYSILTKLGIKLSKPLMIIYQLLTIPILWIFSVLVVQHGVIEVEGKVGSSSNST